MSIWDVVGQFWGFSAIADRGGVTPDFGEFLDKRFPELNLARTDLVGGSFGGRLNHAEKLQHFPVVFVHGNGDRALPYGMPYMTGWATTKQYFESQGYKSHELYATTWGDGAITSVPFETHSKKNVMQVRKHLEAVLEYTGAKKINIVSHSMGVTLARLAILGGDMVDSNGNHYDIGAPLTSKVNVFVGISGPNAGLASGAALPFVPTTDMNTGLCPGYLPGDLFGRSKVLSRLAETEHFEGKHVYSIRGMFDEVNSPFINGTVFGADTAKIPGQDGEIAYDVPGYSHVMLKDLGAEDTFKFISQNEPKSPAKA